MMKINNLLILASIAIVMGMTAPAFATLIEITSIDTNRALTSEADYADDVNSGVLLGVFEGNDSNLISEIEDWLISNEGYSIDFLLEEDFKREYEDSDAAKSGSWSTDNAISLYVVKASSAFALYDLEPAMNAGTWSTYDLWVRGKGGEALEISHLTGYNSTPVPEPATMILFGTGLIGIAGIRRKFKK